MKILVTGKPKSGKSTLMKTVVNTINGPAKGLLTQEIRVNGERVGFTIVTSFGDRIELAQTSEPSSLKVGRFFVNENYLEEQFNTLSHVSRSDFLYIDEIGEMQLYSSYFSKLVDTYIDSNNDLIASVSSVFVNDQIKSILNRDDVFILKISEEFRIEMNSLITLMLKSMKDFNRLGTKSRRAVIQLANRYSIEYNYTSVSKLFSNAIKYYLTGKVAVIESSKFKVAGEHGSYFVHISNDSWACQCRLSQGKLPYKQASECSHYQAVIIYLASIGKHKWGMSSRA